MKGRNLLGTVSILIVGIVFGAILVSSAGLVKTSKAEEIQIGSESSPIQNISLNDFNTAFIEVAEKVTPSIVSITVVSKMDSDPHKGFDFDWPFNFRDRMPRERQGGGSGVVISEDGYILTNNHVVDNAISVKITLFDNRELDAEVVGTDPLTDLAVVKVDATDLPAAFLGDSDRLKVGSWVMAIGNPLNYLTSTVTAGIVSAIGRNINIIRDKEGYGVEDFIQTDAAINPGNSGGALVDLNGAVIGINSAIATTGFSASYIGYGFAIPINLAKAVAKDLIENGEVSRGYIGVRIGEIDAATAKALGMDKPMGIMIQGIVEDGSAASEDIRAGDVILEVDGREVNKPNQLQSYIATRRAGTQVELLLFREGEELTRKVKLKARDKDDDEKVELADAKESKLKKDNELNEVSFKDLGLTVKDLSESVAKK
ncbi:MAG: trypsin-like peptidase domain-containing protein, partial [Melioribacteraceae bacterium]|nr:trypsin-like peptidase domain-containing protein [Melioribacteraceae bacterium]